MPKQECETPAFPFDALSWALRLKNRRAARALLEKRETLEWREASEYAPLTLGWAPDLLARILDLVPEGEEELYCWHAFRRPEGWRLEVCASLLCAAAAVDDLRAVDLLLARGYETGEHELHRNTALSTHRLELADIRTNCPVRSFIPGHVFFRAPPGMRQEEARFLRDVSPLAAAIFCEAETCALRLLEECGGELDISARHAFLRWDQLGGPTPPATAETVTAALGTDLPELLEPGEIYCWQRNSTLFLECLKRHRTRVHPEIICYMLEQANQEEWARAGLRLITPARISDGLLELVKGADSSSWETLRWLLSRPGLELTLDRNAVPPGVWIDFLLACLDHVRVVGRVSKEALSGLAVNLLDFLLARAGKNGSRTRLAPLFSDRIKEVLKKEDPALVCGYLREKGEDWTVRLILSALGVREEVNYAL